MSRKSRKNSKKKTKNNLPGGLEYELNNIFYKSNPSEYFIMKTEMLSLLVVDDQELENIFKNERKLGSVTIGGSPVPRRVLRERMLATEAVVLFHHAAETLLRFYFSHRDFSSAPWVAISKDKDFAAFKKKILKEFNCGFDEQEVCRVFLGVNEVDCSDSRMVEAVESFRILLKFVAGRYLDESFLYNSVKHGLSAIYPESDSEMVLKVGDDELPMLSGHPFIYLHEQRQPGVRKGESSFYSLTQTLAEQDLGLVVCIANAIECIWKAGRNLTLGSSESLKVYTVKAVKNILFGPILSQRKHIRSFICELPYVNDEGDVNPINIFLKREEMDEEWIKYRQDKTAELEHFILNLDSRKTSLPHHLETHNRYLPF